MTVWRGWIQGAKAIWKDAVKMVEATRYSRGDIIRKAKRNANRGVEEAYEAKEIYGEEYRFAVIVDETTPHLRVILLLSR